MATTMPAPAHAPRPNDAAIRLLPVFEPLVPIPEVVELNAGEGWDAFVDAVRGGDKPS